MLEFSGVIAAAGGVFLFSWYRTVAALPVSQRPSFIHWAVYKWGVPATSCAVFVLGILIVLRSHWRTALGVGGAAILVLFLLIRFDRYSAATRLIFDHYRVLRHEKPGMEDLESLFHTAQWRYPQWPQDRVLQFVAGKNIAELILLILITENGINPISDWELYRSLKLKVARITRDRGV
jgi:hypothetical protein